MISLQCVHIDCIYVHIAKCDLVAHFLPVNFTSAYPLCLLLILWNSVQVMDHYPNSKISHPISPCSCMIIYRNVAPNLPSVFGVLNDLFSCFESINLIYRVIFGWLHICRNVCCSSSSAWSRLSTTASHPHLLMCRFVSMVCSHSGKVLVTTSS